MKLRTRLALLAALTVAVAIVVAAVGAQRIAEREFLAQIDVTLRQRANLIGRIDDLVATGQFGSGGRGRDRFGPNNPFGRGASDETFQLILEDGRVFPPDQPLPIDRTDVTIAQGEAPQTVRTVETGEEDYRLLTVPVRGGAIQVARSLDEFNATTARIGRTLSIAGGIGVALAALAGLLVARSALRPVDELTETVEHVTETREFGARIAVERNDEVGRLAERFNEMLDALQSSQQEQQLLVRDAGHELRTPLTALRTNIDVLARGHELSESARRELLAAATDELRELSTLTAELVELAADPAAVTEASVEVDLRELVERVAERFRRRSDHEITVTGETATVVGRIAELERAVGNLLDNALKWSPPGVAIEAIVGKGLVAVEDAGPGIPPGDESRVFDRFYRSDAARTKPGSGLGLAIVSKIVAAHGGRVFAGKSRLGGARVGFELPVEAAQPAD